MFLTPETGFSKTSFIRAQLNSTDHHPLPWYRTFPQVFSIQYYMLVAANSTNAHYGSLMQQFPFIVQQSNFIKALVYILWELISNFVFDWALFLQLYRTVTFHMVCIGAPMHIRSIIKLLSALSIYVLRRWQYRLFTMSDVRAYVPTSHVFKVDRHFPVFEILITSINHYFTITSRFRLRALILLRNTLGSFLSTLIIRAQRASNRTSISRNTAPL